MTSGGQTNRQTDTKATPYRSTSFTKATWINKLHILQSCIQEQELPFHSEQISIFIYEQVPQGIIKITNVGDICTHVLCLVCSVSEIFLAYADHWPSINRF